MQGNTIKRLSLIIINLILLVAIGFGYQKILKIQEEKNYQKQFAKAVEMEAETEKGKDVQIQEGLVGETYVTVYFPMSQGVAVEGVKEKIQEELAGLGTEGRSKKPKELFLYHSEVAEAPFVGYTPYQIKRAEYRYQKGNSSRTKPRNSLFSIWMMLDTR